MVWDFPATNPQLREGVAISIRIWGIWRLGEINNENSKKQTRNAL